MKLKTTLITGGAGFIGSHLCKILLGQKHKVICIDNLSTGSKKNITEFLSNKNFLFKKHDIIKPLNLKIKIDEIYNLACPASPNHYQKDPIFTLKTNFIGTLNLLELAKKNNAKFLQASTSEIYGDPKIHPQKETYFGNANPIGIRACYDEGKRCAEALCMDFKRQFNLDIRIVRIFNTYGPNMQKNDGRVVSNFIVQALKNNNITIYGNGNQTRSFMYIDDLIDGMIKIMQVKKISTPINLGNPQEFTIKQLAVTTLKLTGSKSKVKYLKLPQDDPKQRKPDISLAKKEIKWTPSIKLQDGLQKTISYFQSLR
ncbi:NAD-dependent dehydratase [Candidatus Peregrinibacteria bacterium RIFOXYA12_FULL_33_12]|nr:MAG: NAD-dependent dehydratase [Candidatus Peregrinibacteria bacterium RIFOXYA12_FULL_33_12]